MEFNILNVPREILLNRKINSRLEEGWVQRTQASNSKRKKCKSLLPKKKNVFNLTNSQKTES